MSRILYFDCFSGASGDMVLGALLDAGLPMPELQRALGSLTIDSRVVSAEKVLRAGVTATKFHVAGQAGHDCHRDQSENEHSHADDHSHPHSSSHSHADDHLHANGSARSHLRGETHPHRSLPEISALVDRSALTESGKERVKGMFRRLAEAEAAIHRMSVEQVHLHEVGALDSIVDIVGAVFGLEWFGADRIVSSPLNVGGGMVRSAHGVFPVPAPATVSLLKGVPIYSSGAQAELVTPTGALIVTEFATSFGAIPPMSVTAIGYGAGARDPKETPNVLRLMIGEEAVRSPVERVVMLSSEIDDMNPQIFGLLMDRLYAAGALEVFFSSVQMKKNRPGTLVSVIGHPSHRAVLTDLFFRETTTIGVRVQEVERECLEREIKSIDTPLGPVRFKIARRAGDILNAAPEFDDCAALSTRHGLAVKAVQAIAVRAYLDSR